MDTRAKVIIGAVVLIGIVLVFLFAGNGLWQTRQLKTEVTALRDHVDKHAANNEIKRQRVDDLERENPVVIEEDARNLGMVKEGESDHSLKQKDQGKKVVKKENK